MHSHHSHILHNLHKLTLSCRCKGWAYPYRQTVIDSFLRMMGESRAYKGTRRLPTCSHSHYSPLLYVSYIYVVRVPGCTKHLSWGFAMHPQGYEDFRRVLPDSKSRRYQSIKVRESVSPSSCDRSLPFSILLVIAPVSRSVISHLGSSPLLSQHGPASSAILVSISLVPRRPQVGVRNVIGHR